MANRYATPTGILLTTAQTTIYQAPASILSMLIVRFCNIDTVARKIRVWISNGALPAPDAQCLLYDFPLPPGGLFEHGPVYLPTGWKYIALADIANKVVAVPNGVESTS